MQSTESYLTKVSPDINKLLTIDETMIEDILFEIEIDALEFLGIIFPNSSLIY
jgi:hypothetical protein